MHEVVRNRNQLYCTQFILSHIDTKTRVLKVNQKRVRTDHDCLWMTLALNVIFVFEKRFLAFTKMPRHVRLLEQAYVYKVTLKLQFTMKFKVKQSFVPIFGTSSGITSKK